MTTHSVSAAQERSFIASHSVQPDLLSPEDALPVRGKTLRSPARGYGRAGYVQSAPHGCVSESWFRGPVSQRLFLAIRDRFSCHRWCACVNSMVSYMQLDVAAKKAAMAWTPTQGPPRTEASSVGCAAKALPNSAVPFCLTIAIQSCPGAGRAIMK